MSELLNRENFECIVMDDEKHIKFDSETLLGPQLYTKLQGSICRVLFETHIQILSACKKNEHRQLHINWEKR